MFNVASLKPWRRSFMLTAERTVGQIGLKPWRRSFMLTAERTVGQIGLNKNGSYIDIWMRVEKKPQWVAILRSDLEAFLASDDSCAVIRAESDGNSETSLEEDATAGMRRDDRDL